MTLLLRFEVQVVSEYKCGLSQWRGPRNAMASRDSHADVVMT
jgi:hypothetical protein